MLRRIWQRLKSFFQRLLGTPPQPSPPRGGGRSNSSQTPTPPSLTGGLGGVNGLLGTPPQPSPPRGGSQRKSSQTPTPPSLTGGLGGVNGLLGTPPQPSPPRGGSQRKSSQTPTPPSLTGGLGGVKPTRTDIEYEVLFAELLEGVNQGWSRGRVSGFLIGRGITEAQLAAWLRPFGERLLATPEQHQELVRRIVLLGELRGGELGQVAGEIGRQISALIPPPPVSPISTDNVWRGEVIEAEFVGDGLSVSKGMNRRDAENTEKKNSEVGEDANVV